MVATTAGDIAVLALAFGWVVVVGCLAVVFFKLAANLEASRIWIDQLRQTTVPMLGDVRVTIQSVNKELERVDSLMESGGNIAKSGERIAGAVEQVVTSPLIKVAAATAGIAAFVKRFRGDKD